MGFLGFGKKDKVIDLTEGYKRQVAKAEQERKLQQGQASSGSPFSFFDPPSTNSSDADMSESPEERKKRLAKRIMEMTERMEDISNQIYHLQQRVEVLERKLDMKRV